MSLYNSIKGRQPATFFILPMLGKHPDQYPRFRDCFIGKMRQSDKLDEFGIPILEHGDGLFISVYTRVGGGNRENYEKEIDILKAHPEYVEDFDDEYDCTYATFIFKVPSKYQADFKLLTDGHSSLMETSAKYKAQVDKVYPKLKGRLPWHD